MPQPPLVFFDHEGKQVTYTPNGDTTKYGAHLELATDQGVTVTVHLTPARLAVFGRRMIADASETPGAPAGLPGAVQVTHAAAIAEPANA